MTAAELLAQLQKLSPNELELDIFAPHEVYELEAIMGIEFVSGIFEKETDDGPWRFCTTDTSPSRLAYYKRTGRSAKIGRAILIA